MAWRLHEHVLRGKIDNRTRGRVSGEIWLAGIDEPLILELTGNCAPDLAGCELSFENPDAIPMTTKPPAPQQCGPAGDLTAHPQGAGVPGRRGLDRTRAHSRRARDRWTGPTLS